MQIPKIGKPPRILQILSAASAMVASVLPLAAKAQSASAPVVLDPTFRTPAPPNDMYPQIAEHVFISTGVMLAIALMFMAIAARDGRRFKSTVPLALVAGAAFCVVPEAIDNYLAGCFWTRSHDPSKLMFTLMGRDFEYYVGVMWWAFGAILGYVIYAVLLREVRTGVLWAVLALSGMADIVLEEILLNYGGIYTYFGHQPLVLISRFPWWWLFVNVSALFLGVSLAYRFRDWFNGWKSVFILLLLPFCYIGGFTLAGMPAILVIQGDYSPLTTQLGGLASCVIALIQIGLTMFLVLGRDPLGSAERRPVGSAGSGFFQQVSRS